MRVIACSALNRLSGLYSGFLIVHNLSTLFGGAEYVFSSIFHGGCDGRHDLCLDRACQRADALS